MFSILNVHDEINREDFPQLIHIPRSIRFYNYYNFKGWTIKLYYIKQHAGDINNNLLSRAKELTLKIFPEPALCSFRYGLGFIIIHEADMFNQIVFDWWEHVNELRHVVYKSLPGRNYEFVNITDKGEPFCIWELQIISFEKDGWLKYVIGNKEIDLKSYLAHQLNTNY